MNAKLFTSIFIIVFIVGLCAGSAGFYYIFYRPVVAGFELRTEQYRTRQRELAETIRGIQLENRALIEGIRGAKEDLLREAGEIIKGTSSSVNKIREITQLLYDYYNN